MAEIPAYTVIKTDEKFVRLKDGTILEAEGVTYLDYGPRYGRTCISYRHEPGSEEDRQRNRRKVIETAQQALLVYVENHS